MHTKRQVRRALVDLSDEDFQMVMDDLDPDAREVAAGQSGRTEQALALAKHFDANGRSLGTLVTVIREIAPGADL